MDLNNPILEIIENRRKLIFVGGKGGTGKTSVSIATGLFLSQKYKTLVISTDPAHSLKHSLVLKDSLSIQYYEIKKNLTLLELDANQTFKKFRTQHKEEFIQLFDTTTNLDKDDINQFFSLTIPGLDELMSFKVIADILESDKWEKIVVDTAPTGHALRLLQTPEVVNDWVKLMAKLRWKYRYIKSTFKGKYHPDDADDLLLSLKKMINRVKSIITDPESCEFIVVCKAEGMIIAETTILLQELSKAKLNVNHLIINDLMPKQYIDDYCEQRREQQKTYVSLLEKSSDKYLLNKIESFPKEVRGLKAITRFKKSLFS